MYSLAPPPKTPTCRWGINQDPPSDDGQWVHWSGYVHRAFYADGEPLPIDDHDVFTDGMMVTAAMEAFLDMENAMTGDAATPRAMTVLQTTMPNTRGELFFSSAIRRNGVGFRIQFPTSCASQALDRCSAINSDLVTGQDAQNSGEIHRTGGNCGEPGAVHLFCREHKNHPIEQGLPAGSRIVTVGRAMETHNLVIFNPCGLDNIDLEKPVPTPAWGCERFLNDVNIPAIPSTTTPIPIAAAWRFDYSYTYL